MELRTSCEGMQSRSRQRGTRQERVASIQSRMITSSADGILERQAFDPVEALRLYDKHRNVFHEKQAS